MLISELVEKRKVEVQEWHECMLHALESVSTFLGDVELPEGAAPSISSGSRPGLYFSAFSTERARSIIDALPISGFTKRVSEDVTTFHAVVADIDVDIAVYAALCELMEVKLPRSEWVTTKKILAGCRPLSATFRAAITPVDTGA